VFKDVFFFNLQVYSMYTAHVRALVLHMSDKRKSNEMKIRSELGPFGESP
jgi:hypothetical protein